MRIPTRCRSRCRRSARERRGCACSTPSRPASKSVRTPAARCTRCRDVRWRSSCFERRRAAGRPTPQASRSSWPIRFDMERTQVSVTVARDETAAADPPRVVIERLRPEIDAGRFPIKRTVGEAVSVTVDMFADGHDLLAGVLKYRRVPAGRPAAEPALQGSSRRRPGPASAEASADRGPGSASGTSADPAKSWTEIPLTLLGNDSWAASFTVTELGENEYTVDGWIDRFGTWLKGLIAKSAAGQDVENELLEGAALVEETVLSDLLRSDRPQSERVDAARDPRVRALMESRPDRRMAATYARVL